MLDITLLVNQWNSSLIIVVRVIDFLGLNIDGKLIALQRL